MNNKGDLEKTGNDVMAFYKKQLENRESLPKMIYVESPNDDNPLVKCPVCEHEGRIMDDFSYLASGYNGIKQFDADDLDVQECGHCGAKLNW